MFFTGSSMFSHVNFISGLSLRNTTNNSCVNACPIVFTPLKSNTTSWNLDIIAASRLASERDIGPAFWKMCSIGTKMVFTFTEKSGELVSQPAVSVYIFESCRQAALSLDFCTRKPLRSIASLCSAKKEERDNMNDPWSIASITLYQEQSKKSSFWGKILFFTVSFVKSFIFNRKIDKLEYLCYAQTARTF